MKYVGAHVSAAGGIENTVVRAKILRASAFSFFVKNQLKWKSPELDQITIKKFKKACNKFSFTNKQIIPHASYLINLGNPNPDLRKKSNKSLIDEINRCNQLNIKLLNVHPGNHLNQVSEQECIQLISSSINYVLKKTTSVILVLENTAGQGTCIGYSFEHIAEIIKNIQDQSRIGVCLDTCHLFAAGYDIRTKETFEKTFLIFEKVIGFKYLKAMHLNDSKNFLNSKKDRHQNLGLGFIGKNPFSLIMKDSRFNNIPIILETIDSNLWKKEIFWLNSIKTKK